MDMSLLTTCRETGITKTSSNASEFRTCRNCGGITHKTVGILSKTTFDLTKDNAVHSETVEQPVTNLLHQEGFRCSHCAEPLENYDALQAEVDADQLLHNLATEGTAMGTYGVGTKATFQTAINAAIAIVSADNSAQATINAALVTLKTAAGVFSATKRIEGSYAAIEAEIDAAQAIHDAATEGNNVGQYASGSKATFQTAITAAQALVTASDSIQSEIDAAQETLADAVDDFETAEHIEGDYADLQDDIDDAQALHDAAVEGSSQGQYAPGSKATFQTAITAAQALVTASNSTQAQIDAAQDTLETAVGVFEGGKVT